MDLEVTDREPGLSLREPEEQDPMLEMGQENQEEEEDLLKQSHYPDGQRQSETKARP